MTKGILPDFLIIGAMKAGTTTLYEYLSHHPQVGMSREKETDYFIEGRGAARGLPWYQAQFTPGRKVYGEASPNYTKCQAFPGVPDRVATLIPHCKLIYIVRDPVARANSQFRHAVLSGEVPISPEKEMNDQLLQHLIDTSSYNTQIQPWLARFPLKNILFLQFENLISDPSFVLSKIAAFLEISDSWPARGVISANSSDSLGRLPPWLFLLRKMKVAGWIKKFLSGDIRRRLKSAIETRKPRSVPELSKKMQNKIWAEVVVEMVRFHEVSGISLRRPDGSPSE